MTRKDYILIADALNQTRRPISFAVESGAKSYEDILRGIDKAVESIAATLGRDNPRFDREHFLAVVRGEKDLNSRPARKAVS